MTGVRWVRHIFRIGLRRPIGESDIYECLPEHGSHKLSTVFGRLWDEERQKKDPSLVRVMWRIYAKKFGFVGFFFNMMDTLCKCVRRMILSNR